MTEQPNHRGLPRRTSADTEGEVQRVLGKIEASGQNLLVLRLVANSPHAFRPFLLFADALLNKATLPRPVMEVVVLWLAQHHDAPYEWAEHEPMALRAGLNQAQIDSLRDGQVPESLFSDDDRLAVDFAAALSERGDVQPTLWTAAVDTWGTEGALDLVFTIGWWGGLVLSLVRALGLQSPDEL